MNAEIGNQMATILLTRVLAPLAIYTAIQTNQLHSKPLTKACEKGREVLATASDTAAGPDPKVPLANARYAKMILPRKLPI